MRLDKSQRAQLNLGLGSADLVTNNASYDEDGEDNDWAGWAANWVEAYAAKTGRFMVEDLIAHLKNNDYYFAPHDDRAWGGVTYRLSRRGVIRLYGFALSRTHHASPKRVWESTTGVYNPDDLPEGFPVYDDNNTLVVV